MLAAYEIAVLPYPRFDVMESFDLMTIPTELSPAVQELLISVLGEEERERYSRMGHPRRRVEYLLGHALLRLRLSQLLNVSPKEVPLAFEKGERPHLPNHLPQFHVSLSHCDGLLALAIAHFPVGVDAEQVSHRKNLAPLARRVFSLEECSAVRFAELWTLREAFFKACGEAVTAKDEWNTRFFYPVSDRIVALAANGDLSRALPAFIDLDEMISWIERKEMQ